MIFNWILGILVVGSVIRWIVPLAVHSEAMIRLPQVQQILHRRMLVSILLFLFLAYRLWA